MRIAVCTLTGAPDDVRVWSGTPAHFLKGLRAVHDDVVTIGPIAPLAYKALNKFAGLTGKLGRKINWEAEPAALRFFTKLFDREVARVKPDVVIVMGWYPLRPNSGVPVVYWGDATVGQRINEAPHWSGLSKRTATRAAPVESEALNHMTRTMWASKWAADDAAGRYGLHSPAVAGFAANIPDPGHQISRNQEPVKLLSVGVKWHRKGMDRAVETADALRSQGIDVHLDVVGVMPPDATWERPYVTYHGRIDKADPDGLAKLSALYSSASIFLLPTRNEPFGIVFQEAAAYALPSVASNVGGVPEIVQDGVTGITLGPDASPADYAHAVHSILEPATRRAMASAARQRYEDHFTWEAAARRVLEACQQSVPASSR